MEGDRRHRADRRASSTARCRTTSPAWRWRSASRCGCSTSASTASTCSPPCSPPRSGSASARGTCRRRCTCCSVTLVAIVVGMAWAAIPALLKVTRNVNEVISTIMLNYIATFLGLYLLRKHFDREDPNVAETGLLPKAARIPGFNRLFEAVGFHMPNNVVLQGFMPVAIAVGVGYYVAAQPQPLRFRPPRVGRQPERGQGVGHQPQADGDDHDAALGRPSPALIGLAPLLADRSTTATATSSPRASASPACRSRCSGATIPSASPSPRWCGRRSSERRSGSASSASRRRSARSCRARSCSPPSSPSRSSSAMPTTPRRQRCRERRPMPSPAPVEPAVST